MALSDNNNLPLKLLQTNAAILQEPSYKKALHQLLLLLQNICHADGLNFFIVSEHKTLTLIYSNYISLGISRSNADSASYYAPVLLKDIKKKKRKTVVEACLLGKEIINSDNIFSQTDYDNAYFENFDAENRYTTFSVLNIPLISSRLEVNSVVQLINAQDAGGRRISFSSEIVDDVLSVCGLINSLTQNKLLKDDYEQLLESFIAILIRALDTKSPYTGLHCQRVPVIARLLAEAAVEEKSGSLKDFTMNPSEWYALHLASWLHDCGKITTPEYIVDKATKLETVNNRIHEIRNRFEILRRDAHIEYLQKRLKNADTQENLQQNFVATVNALEDDFAFIAECNIGDKALSDEDISRLNDISKRTFTRYFSRMQGLSWAEKALVKDQKIYDGPCLENVLQNRPDHLQAPYNLGELYNLSTKQGTITKEERQKINEHINVTIDMLKSIPFPEELSQVTEYAGAHHERVDGKGYPNGLTGKQMSVPAKIMAIADIFEALTASDRPYKAPKKLSEVLAIMQEMKNSGHIDPDLYRAFIENEVYMDYANQYLDAEQIDNVNPEEFL